MADDDDDPPTPGPTIGEVGQRRAVSPLALVLVELDGVPERLIASHVADRAGYCRTCSMAQAGPQRWPCSLYATAVEAQAVAAARREPSR